MRRIEKALALAVGLFGCDPFHTGFEDLEEARYYRAEQRAPVPAPRPVLRVMNYNVKFGGGRIDFFFDCFGGDRHYCGDVGRIVIFLRLAALRSGRAGLRQGGRCRAVGVRGVIAAAGRQCDRKRGDSAVIAASPTA